MTDLPATEGDFSREVDQQTPASWGDVLAQFEDASIYQTWAYGAVRWGARNLSHLVLRKDGQVLAAAQLRIARVPVLPAGIAYLRWGPLCHRKGQVLDPGTVAEMMRSLRDEYCGRRGLTLQVIPGACPGDVRGMAYEDACAKAGLHPDPAAPCYRTVMVDLSPAAEVMRKQLDQKWRNQLNRSEKNGLVLEVSDKPEAYREFVTLYGGMLERKQFETTVDVDEFDRIQALLDGPARMQVFLAKKDGESVGALVCSHMGDTAIYLLGATNEKARELKASYFLQWQVMLWMKDRGARRYDLGGIDPVANPGGYHFKSGFGGVEVIQLPPHSATGGALGGVVLRGISWLRRSRTSSKAAGRGAS